MTSELLRHAGLAGWVILGLACLPIVALGVRR